MGRYGTQKAEVTPVTCKDKFSQELLLLAPDRRREHKVGHRGWFTVCPWAEAATSVVTQLSQLLSDC